jgi:hypothetical protein
MLKPFSDAYNLSLWLNALSSTKSRELLSFVKGWEWPSAPDGGGPDGTKRRERSERSDGYC